MGPQKMMSARPQTMKNSKNSKKKKRASIERKGKNPGDPNEGKV